MGVVLFCWAVKLEAFDFLLGFIFLGGSSEDGFSEDWQVLVNFLGICRGVLRLELLVETVPASFVVMRPRRDGDVGNLLRKEDLERLAI